MDSGQYGEAGEKEKFPLTGIDTNLINFVYDKINNDPSTAESSNSGSDNSNVGKQKQLITTEKKFQRVIDINNRYEITDKGPYFIYVESGESDVNSKLHPMRVGRILDEIEPNLQVKLLEVTTVGRNRIKVEVQDSIAANQLVTHSVFPKHKLIAYVPTHCTQRKGVVRGVDTSFSEQFVLANIKSNVTVLSVKRLTRMVDDNDNKGKLKEVPRQMLVLTFKGLTLPDYVIISRVRCPVEAHVAPVIQCYNCLRYGHVKSQCKSHKRCKECGTEHSEENACDESKKRCIYCQSPDHSATSKNCPAYQKQRKIKFTMATMNLSFKEAEKAIKNPSFSNITQSNRFFVFNNLAEDFPPLPKQAPGFNSKPTSSNFNRSQVIPSAKKRKKVSETSSTQPTRVQSEFHFCGPPISQNPHSEKSVDFKTVLFDNIQHAINKLVTHKDFTTSESPNLEFIPKVREAINDILDKCSSQLKSPNEDYTMEC